MVLDPKLLAQGKALIKPTGGAPHTAPAPAAAGGVLPDPWAAAPPAAAVGEAVGAAMNTVVNHPPGTVQPPATQAVDSRVPRADNRVREATLASAAGFTRHRDPGKLTDEQAMRHLGKVESDRATATYKAGGAPNPYRTYINPEHSLGNTLRKGTDFYVPSISHGEGDALREYFPLNQQKATTLSDVLGTTDVVRGGEVNLEAALGSLRAGAPQHLVAEMVAAGADEVAARDAIALQGINNFTKLAQTVNSISTNRSVDNFRAAHAVAAMASPEADALLERATGISGIGSMLRQEQAQAASAGGAPPVPPAAAGGGFGEWLGAKPEMAKNTAVLKHLNNGMWSGVGLAGAAGVAALAAHLANSGQQQQSYNDYSALVAEDTAYR